MTSAAVYPGPNASGEVAFAQTATEGSRFEIGRLTIEVLETPGHTDDHLAFVIHDTEYSQGPVGVFISGVYARFSLSRIAVTATSLLDETR